MTRHTLSLSHPTDQRVLIDPDIRDRFVRYHCYVNLDGYVVVATRKRILGHLHRLIMAPIPNGLHIDHINGNKLDNRRSNLRLATRSQNAANQPLTSRNRSGYKGVSASRTRWKARIQHQGTIYHLGVFKAREEAAWAYNVAAELLFGKFAYLNPDLPQPDQADAIREQVNRKLARKLAA